MNKLALLLIGLIWTGVSICQNNEFKVYPNGLIYSEQAMSKLSSIVDQLNLKFKTCDFNKVFYSKQQTIGHLVKLDSGDLVSARKDMDQNISFEDFLKKHPQTKVEKNILIIKSKYTNYEDKEIVLIEHFDLRSGYGLEIESEDVSLYDKDFTKTWYYDYNPESDYSKERIYSFYFDENFKSTELPNKYSLMVGYTDCLVDTTTTKFKEDLESGWVDLPNNWSNLSQQKKEKLLDEMRSTRVIGGCSMDSRPREHAVNIALLSAETYNWEVFLKAHLDIMNDRFERMSDGSYAWGARNTYIKELEELNINVTDLILGSTFRIENPASNHYYSSISRVGRALSETKNKEEVEEAILSAIKDPQLDNYNRLLFYFLYKNYNYYTQDEDLKKVNSEKLASAAATLPEYFSNKLIDSGK